MLTLRRAEGLLASEYPKGEMRTPTHFGILQEAVSVGVCEALNLPHDVVYGSHRSHLSYLACGGSFYKLACELYGKEAGCSRGRGGSVHLTARDRGYVCSSAILSQTVAVAAGSALAFKIRKEPHIATVFCGDAAPEEGTFWETCNYASLNKLPLLIVLENNLYSTESSLATRYALNASFCDRAYSFGVAVKRIDGMDVSDVYTTALGAIELVRSGQPTLIEASCYREREHVGPGIDHLMGRTYRTEAEWNEWQDKDPIKRNAAAILKAGLATQDELTLMDLEISVGLEADAHCARLAEPAHGLMGNI